MKIGGLIASFREKQKMDQRKLAEELGVSVTYISLVENDKKDPSPEFTLSVIEYLGIPMHAAVVYALQGTKLKTLAEQEAFEAAEWAVKLAMESMFSRKGSRKQKGKTGKARVQRKKINY